MAGINKAIIMGTLGKDPELRQTNSGKSVCSFSIATSENWTDAQGERQERTEWHNCTAWGKTGESISQFFKKGQRIMVEGSLQTERYEKDGVERQSTKIRVDAFHFVDKKASSNSSNSGSRSVARTSDRLDDLEADHMANRHNENDDCPF